MTKFVFAILASLSLGEAIHAEELNINSSTPSQEQSSYNQGTEPTREIARRRSRRRRRGHRRHRRHHRRW